MENENKDDHEIQSQLEGSEERISAFKLTKFPQTRVRNMMKLDPDLHLASQESVHVISKAAVGSLTEILKTSIQSKIPQKMKCFATNL